MDETHVVTCFLRHRASVLLVRRSDAVGSYSGLWGGVSGYAEGQPTEQAHNEIDEETGLTTARCVRSGEPLSVTDDRYDTEWIVHPYLFDCDSRAVEPNKEIAEYEWVSPVEIHRRETVPGLWAAYERVAPTVDTVAADDEHGAEYLSLRALELLRDAASVREYGTTDRSLSQLARRLQTARPNMSVVATRINRVMYDAGADASVLGAAERAIKRVLSARDRVTEAGVDQLPEEPTVLTLSRSGTVRRTLERVEGALDVYVAVSRPGGEGIAVAESLSSTADVTLLPDGAIAHALSTAEIDAVLLGADTVLADGRVVNKVGTRTAAIAAAHEGIPVYAVTTEDKIRPEQQRTDSPDQPVNSGGGEATVYDGTVDLDVLAPIFDVTPAALITVVTEDGPQSVADIERTATRHREYTTWDQ
ncbi:NUDIX domain-containing protein [Halocatena pleomorpha]|uniref:NUDIX domain-containing protein n=1 Tax=Halocatena pleomorpha TaxID=1785090 RepID=A0A3P3R6T8_9EURY|nr:NUDIX domain-containing protein [Halocatena pleomorpha]RRJ28639.1 NUDIX domain-containing protein [Halocatena pleomorpha]